MEDRLDRCAETCRVYSLVWPVPAPTDSLEAKVRVLLIDPDWGHCPEKPMRCLGECILEIKALLARIEAVPESAEQTTLAFLNAYWFSATDTVNQRLQQMMDGFCSLLDDMDEALIRGGEEKLLRDARHEHYIEMQESWQALFSKKSYRFA